MSPLPPAPSGPRAAGGPPPGAGTLVDAGPHADLLATAERSAFGPGAWSPAQLASALAAPAPQRPVARLALGPRGQALGHSLGVVLFDEAELFRIGVQPGARGQGLGHRLLVDFARAAWDQGARRLLLEVAADNLPALALYRRFGLAEDGRRTGYYAGGRDAVLMSCPLEPPC